MWKRFLAVAAVATLSLGIGGCTRYESTYVKKVTEADNLSKELSALQKKYAALQDENARLKAHVDKLTADLATMTGNRDRLSSDLAAMTADRDRLKSELSETAARRDKLAADNRDLENTLRAKSDTLSQTISDLRGKIANLEAENGRLKAEAASLQKVHDEKVQRVTVLEGENVRLREEIAGLQKAQEEKIQKASSTYEGLIEKLKGEISQGQVTISELKGKLTVNMVDAILFDLGKAEVKKEGQAILEKVVSIVKDVKDRNIRVEGHTDNNPIRGMLARTYPTNWELSSARALNVTRYLQDQGIDPRLLSAIAYGEHKPVADNGTPEGQAKNRRIEIVLVPKE